MKLQINLPDSPLVKAALSYWTTYDGFKTIEEYCVNATLGDLAAGDSEYTDAPRVRPIYLEWLAARGKTS
jgi:hypothetical protein